MGLNGQQIYDNFTQGSTERMRLAADKIKELTDRYVDRAGSMKDLDESMQEHWVGESADAASSGARPLVSAFIETAEPLDKTNSSMQAQTDSFDHSRRNVVPVPPAPEKPNPWTTGLKAAIPVAGPFMAADDLDNYEDGMRAHNEAAQRNVDVMDGYTTHTSSSQGALPANFGVLRSDGAAISIGTNDTAAIDNSTRAAGAGPVPGGSASDGPAGVVPVGGRPGGGAPSYTNSVAPPSSSTPVTSSPTGSVGGPNSPTNTAGTPIAGGAGPVGDRSRGGAGSPANRTPGSGGFRSPAGRETAGKRLLDSNSAKGTGGAPGGGVPKGVGGRIGGGGAGGVADGTARGGAAADSARGLAGGKATGAALPGATGAAESTPARSAAGSTGRSAMGGPMGAGGGRGKGGEDEEHQRKTEVQENDPESLFRGDLGKTTPPVIGQ